MLFQGSIEQDYLSEKYKKYQFFGVFNKNINFSTEESTESALKTKTYHLIFLIELYSSKMTISIPLKWEINTAEVTLL